MAIAFPPARSMALTTATAASAPFVYVMAIFAPSAARRLAIAAPMPREPPVMSATFPSNFFDTVRLLEFRHLLIRHEPHLLLAQSIPITTLDYPVRPVVAHFKHTLLGLAAMLSKHGGWKWNYDTCV